MRRLLLGLTLVLALAGCGGAGPKVVSVVPRPFRPLAASSFGSRDLWVLGGGVLLRSTDAGLHFERLNGPRLPASGTVERLVFANARDGYAYTRGTTRLYVTHDGGTHWSATGPNTVLGLAIDGANVYVLFTHSTLKRSPLSRTSWRRISLPSEIDAPVSLAARGDQVWLLNGTNSKGREFDLLARSTDGGRTFVMQTGPCFADLGGTLAPAGRNVVWAVCGTGMMAELRLSKDGGRSFPQIPSFHDPGGVQLPLLVNSAQLVATSPRSAVIDAGPQGPLYRTSDLGRSWTRATEIAGLENVSSFAFSTPADGIMLATTRSHPNREQLFRTMNGGASWHLVLIR